MKLIQLSAGQGPSECALAVALCMRHLIQAADASGLPLEVIGEEPGPVPGTFKSVMLQLETDQLSPQQLDFLLSWQGTMQWICKSPYRPRHGRKNWFFNVELWDIDESEPLDERAFEVRTCRASGAGGQHVNTTDSAVQITHLPTGISVRVQTERSQHRNRQLAWVLMRQKLAAQAEQHRGEVKGAMRMQHHQLERGRAVRIFEGPRFRERT